MNGNLDWVLARLRQEGAGDKMPKGADYAYIQLL